MSREACIAAHRLAAVVVAIEIEEECHLAPPIAVEVFFQSAMAVEAGSGPRPVRVHSEDVLDAVLVQAPALVESERRAAACRHVFQDALPALARDRTRHVSRGREVLWQ